MEAMDLLLMACHAQTLNLFVESFLKMVQKLLEDSNPNLQIMATNSVSCFIYHAQQLQKLIKVFYYFSSSSSQTLKKMLRPTIDATTSLSQSFHRCVTVLLMTQNY